ncbi:TRAP transporter large permease [Brevibacillus humidisoli]|uniref:TRAP transporter large permease n=1 Tax=Brevibacillus humidisoli TaxID=2895522 RepID=UPI001E29FF5F|nr:TRAP transporter large permease [Brevibacillus humidisoli]UFJ38903.1 TRAP transporter large permease [Brevibacillus humidisoli]
MTLLLFSLFVILLLFRVPIFVSLALSTIFVLWQQGFTMYTIPQRIFASLDATTLMAIPGFVFAGIIMARGGISKYLIECLRSWVGHLPGGLSVVTILACMLFAAISGSSPATAAAIGSIMIPGMVNAGYDKKYAMGLVAASGTLGILIPPSIPLIIYGTVAEESIGKLFMAGILPGILLGLVLVVSAILFARRKGYGRLEKASWDERLSSSLKAVWGALLPVIILGSIYTGVATPTEAAVVSSLYALIISIFVYREMRWSDFRQIVKETVNTSAMIFFIISAAMVFALYLTNEQVPQQVAEWISQSITNKWIFLIAANILFFILGTFLESVAIILITLPIFLPIIKQMGIDVIHFAIIMTVNMELAMITPPVGLNLFVVSGIAKEKLETVVRGVAPFILIMVMILAVIVVWPDLSLYLTQYVK